jgi:hypothetical protein
MSEKISIALRSLFAANDVNKYINKLFGRTLNVML